MTKKLHLRTKHAAIAAGLTAALGGAVPLQAHACGAEPFIGEICVFAFNYCPTNYMPADGSILPVSSSNQVLFALIGNTYGGTAPTTFALPDLRGRVAAGVGTSTDANVASVTLGKKSGGSTVTLNTNQIAPHTHPATGTATITAGSVITGPLNLPVTGGTVSGQTISGSVTVNALNGDTSVAGKPLPDGTANPPVNTIGKVGNGNPAYYSAGTKPVAVPTSHNLTVSGGTISGASASGNVALPVKDITATATVAVEANTEYAQPVTITPPTLGLTVCIATMGLWPNRD